MLNDNSQFNAGGVGDNDHQYGFLRAIAMSALGILPAATQSVRDAKTAGIYQNAVAYAGATTKGDGVMINCTVAGTATLTLAGGGVVVLSVPVGTLIVPFACTNAVQTTGTMTLFKLTL